MTVRTDLIIDYELSPRIITVQAPSVELNIQDLHDTVTSSFEDSIEGSEHPNLISTAGKEELGGGVLVGLTSTLQNAQVAFETRTTIHETGTVTTPDAAGKVLIDSAALFITNNVERGDLVLNETDGSHSTVTSVDSEIQVTCLPLSGGSDNQFDSADAYKIFDMVQCNVSGGNLVAVDDVGADLDPIFTTFGTQVIRTSSSSATLQELSSIQFASFGGSVTIDVLNGTSGTTFPTGTGEQPVDNLADAKTIATERGLTKISVLGNLTINTGTFDGFSFVGESIAKTRIDVTAGASLVGCEFMSCTLDGVLSGDALVEGCQINDISNVSGIVDRCILFDTIHIASGGDLHILDSWSGVSALNAKHIIDMNGSGQNLIARNYSGGLDITDFSGTSNTIILDFNSGKVTLDALCTDGFVDIRGVASLIDNSAGSTVITNHLIQPLSVRDMWRADGLDASNPMTVTPTGRTSGDVTQDFTGDGVTTTTVTRQ